MSMTANRLFRGKSNSSEEIELKEEIREIKSGRQKKSANPYLDARREWNAQFGRHISEKNSWRVAALISLLTALLSIGGLLTLGASKKVVPFVAVVDDLGNTIATASATSTGSTDPRVVRAVISDFYKNFRSVTTDGYAQKERIKRVYSLISAQDPAYRVMNEHFSNKDNDPFTRAKTITASVNMSSILPLSKNTFQVEWEEVVRDRNGKIVSTEDYQSALTIKQTDQLTGQEMLDNPLGLYVVEISWTRRL